jgi:hypothetical protein
MTSQKDEESIEKALESLSGLLAKRQKCLDEREKELEKAVQVFKREKADIGCGNYQPSDVLNLNVGGTVMAVLRRTITSVEGSMLASRFSGRWDDSIEKDRDGNFFIDQPFELFLPMINYLRDKACETPFASPVRSPQLGFFGNNGERYPAFKRMVEYYGMTPGIYPTPIKLHSGMADNSTISQYPEAGVTANEWSVFKIATEGHDRSIVSFEVTIGRVESMHIGWLSPGLWQENLTSSAPIVGVGENQYSTGLDCARCGFVVAGQFTKIQDLSIDQGAVIRCENQGKRWLVNGKEIEPSSSALHNTVKNNRGVMVVADVIPAFSGKGEWKVTAVELAH